MNAWRCTEGISGSGYNAQLWIDDVVQEGRMRWRVTLAQYDGHAFVQTHERIGRHELCLALMTDIRTALNSATMHLVDLDGWFPPNDEQLHRHLADWDRF